MKNFRIAIWILACALLFSLAQKPMCAKNPIRLRIGTMAPEDTLWHEILKYIKQEWGKITNNEVEVKIFAGGVLGDESEMVEHMRGEALQAVGLTSAGLSRIDKSINCLQIPMMFRSYEELDYVRDRIGPLLEKKLEERGFKLLLWADAGWVYTFAKNPVRTPDELRKMKLFTQAGDSVTEKLWKDLGFRVFTFSLTDIITALQTGKVNAFNLPPEFALSINAYRQAPNMIGIRWLPLVAGTVIDMRAWERIPEKYRPQMLEAAQEAGNRYRDGIRKMGEDSIREMKVRRLNVVELDSDEVAIWQREAEEAYKKLRGPYAPADLFDEVRRLRDEFRASKETDRVEK